MSSSGTVAPEDKARSNERQDSAVPFSRTPQKPTTPNPSFHRVFTPRAKSSGPAGNVAQEQKVTREMQSNAIPTLSSPATPQQRSSEELDVLEGPAKMQSVSSQVSVGPRLVDGNQLYNRAVVDHYDNLQSNLHSNDVNKNVDTDTQGSGIGALDSRRSLLEVDLTQQPVPPQTSFIVRSLQFLFRTLDSLEDGFLAMAAGKQALDQHTFMCLYRATVGTRESKSKACGILHRDDNMGGAWLREELSVTTSALQEHETSARREEAARLKQETQEEAEARGLEEALQSIGDLVRRLVLSRVPPRRQRQIWSQDSLSEVLNLTARVVEKCVATATLPSLTETMGSTLEKMSSNTVPPVSLKYIYYLCIDRLHSFELQSSLYHSRSRNMLQNSKTPTVTAMMSPSEASHFGSNTSYNNNNNNSNNNNNNSNNSIQHHSIHNSVLSALQNADSFYQDSNSLYKESTITYTDPRTKSTETQPPRHSKRRSSLTGFMPEVVPQDPVLCSPTARLLHSLSIPYYGCGPSTELYYSTMGSITPAYLAVLESSRQRSSGWSRYDALVRIATGASLLPVKAKNNVLVRADGCLDSDEESADEGGVGLDGPVKPAEGWNGYLEYKETVERESQLLQSSHIPRGFSKTALEQVLHRGGRVPAVVFSGWSSWEHDDLDRSLRTLGAQARQVPQHADGMLKLPTSQWTGDARQRGLSVIGDQPAFSRAYFSKQVASWYRAGNAQLYMLSCYMHLLNERVFVARAVLGEFLTSGLLLLLGNVFNCALIWPVDTRIPITVQFSMHIPGSGNTSDPRRVAQHLLQTVRQHAALFCTKVLPLFNKLLSIEPTLYTENVLRRSFSGIHKGVHWSQLRLLVRELDVLHRIYSCFDICTVPRSVRCSAAALRALALSTVDARFIVCGGADGIVRIWDLESQTCLGQYVPQKNHATVVTEPGVTYSRATTTYLSTDGLSANYQALLQQPASSCQHSGISFCSFLDFDGTIVSTDLSGCVRVWNTNTGSYTELTEHTDGVLCVGLASRHLVTGSMDGTARIWSLQTNTCTTVLGPLQGWCTAVAISHCERYVITGTASGQLLVWTLSKAHAQQTVKGAPVPAFVHSEHIQLVLPFKDSLVVSLDKKGRLLLWDCATRKTVTVFALPSAALPITAALRQDLLAVACLNRSISIFQVSTGSLVRCIKCNMDVPTSLKWAAYNKQLVGTDTGKVLLIDL